MADCMRARLSGCRSWFCDGSNLSRSKPQSLVTSHQNENREFTTAANNLRKNVFRGRHIRDWENLPKSEEWMFSGPLFWMTVTLYITSNVQALRSRKKYHRKWSCIFQRIVERLLALVSWWVVLKHALSEADEKWNAEAGVQSFVCNQCKRHTSSLLVKSTAAKYHELVTTICYFRVWASISNATHLQKLLQRMFPCPPKLCPKNKRGQEIGICERHW